MNGVELRGVCVDLHQSRTALDEAATSRSGRNAPNHHGMRELGM